ncbi:glycine--tRNA ligase subunit beta [Tepidibacillus fermentans]|uniref:Glycine--tRNA ligase beta subunit n=1 Tax=Tepidibacillus fermentans TaxID=1281767 RepID=A0A4R3KJ90_9BACI|nr:glycine--tRNA ligase subunit beta [Tepidibacillus fermentans]TCS83718.1 glycyl-tRNA synthetase beta chain [Tepidibacillus fermentans]
MSKDLLIEIGTEEIPARFITDAVEQLAKKMMDWLKESYITFDKINTYSTPRRLAVMIKDIAEIQQDRIETLRGPSLKIAKDTEGNWTKAAQGFARGQGATVDDLFIEEVNGVEYVFVKKEYKGKEVFELLPQALKEIIESMNFPKNMRWGDEDLRFVRPIRWLLILFGQEVVPVEIAGVKSNNKSYGHRFLGREVTISFVEDYVPQLTEQFVILDPKEREERILAQIHQLEKEKGWNVPIDKGLLEEVIHLVEYPTVLFGHFKEEFLEIPAEVLVTTMREHQRYFPVENKQGELLPYFITVRNGDTRSLDLVAKGNEKVLTARLSDARFFYLEDQKLKIADAVSKLENIVFHEGLGTIGDKVRRIREVANDLAKHLTLDDEIMKQIDRTAEICKFDLVTNMVYEFPELQGLMGQKYALIHGETEEVSKGIFEHYLPRFSGDRLPESIIGQILSIADKMDNIVGAFSLGKIPSGSQDPLGLRRQAAGIVQILLEKLHSLTLQTIFDLVIESYERKGLLKRSKEEMVVDLYEFFTLRLRSLLQEKGVRYDVIDAVLEVEKNDVKRVVDRALILMEEVEDPSFKLVVDSFNRVMNLATKTNSAKTDPERYQQQVEKDLYNQYLVVKENINKGITLKEQLGQLKTLKEPIIQYFDQVMVMVDDEQVRQDRLGLLYSITQLILSYADFRQLVFA